MHVQDETTERAVLHIFRDLGRAYPEGRILLAHAERRWRFTGFRRNDLYEALDRLEQAQCIELEENGGQGVDVVLRERGYRRIAGFPISPRALWRELRSAFQVVIASSRDPIRGPAPVQRRLTDQPGTPIRIARAARIAFEGRVPTPRDGNHLQPGR